MKRKAEDDSTDAPASIGDKKHKKHKKEKREKKQAVALEEPRLTTLVADVVAAAAHPETGVSSTACPPTTCCERSAFSCRRQIMTVL